MAENAKRGADFERKVPVGDDRERRMCRFCDHIDYENPKIVVGSVVFAEDDRILLCRRAIEPRKGYWTIPAGYMELGETPEEGAAREAMEEACADIIIDQLLGIYSVPRISQVQLMFRARLANDRIAVGPESLEVKLFHWGEIPWADMAFPTAVWALRHYHSIRDQSSFIPFTNPAGESTDIP